MRTVEHVEAVKKIAQDRVTRAVIYLVTQGVPLQIAEALNGVELEAWCIVVGEINGGKYNFDMGSWDGEEPDDA